MTTFDEREAAFETRFAYDEELRFKVAARRAKLVGLWAAQRLAKTGDDALAYARTVVKADLTHPGGSGLFAKLRADLPPSVSDADIHVQMLECNGRAVRDVAQG